jgi:hypothetical protein
MLPWHLEQCFTQEKLTIHFGAPQTTYQTQSKCVTTKMNYTQIDFCLQFMVWVFGKMCKGQQL